MKTILNLLLQLTLFFGVASPAAEERKSSQPEHLVVETFPPTPHSRDAEPVGRNVRYSIKKMGSGRLETKKVFQPELPVWLESSRQNSSDSDLTSRTPSTSPPPLDEKDAKLSEKK